MAIVRNRTQLLPYHGVLVASKAAPCLPRCTHCKIVLVGGTGLALCQSGAEPAVGYRRGPTLLPRCYICLQRSGHLGEAAGVAGADGRWAEGVATGRGAARAADAGGQDGAGQQGVVSRLMGCMASRRMVQDWKAQVAAAVRSFSCLPYCWVLCMGTAFDEHVPELNTPAPASLHTCRWARGWSGVAAAASGPALPAAGVRYFVVWEVKSMGWGPAWGWVVEAGQSCRCTSRIVCWASLMCPAL